MLVLTWAFSFSLLALALFSGVEAAGQQEYYGLVESLFGEYNKNVRPTTLGEGTKVAINMRLKSIINLQETAQILHSYASLEIEWNDDYLQWNTSDFGNITRILYPQKELWLPDIVNVNSVESQDQLGYDELKCAIANNGLVTWIPNEIFKTTCDIDVKYYPFDTQKCEISFSTMMSTLDEVNIDPFAIDNEINLDEYSESSVWELASTNINISIFNRTYTRIKFTVELRRLRLYYVVTLLFPVLMLSVASVMVFYLPAESGEKIGMSITVLLAYTVYLTIVTGRMPETSKQVSLFGLYITTLLFLSALSVTLSVIILNIHNRDPAIPITPQLIQFTRYWRQATGLSLPKTPQPSTSSNRVQPINTGETETESHFDSTKGMARKSNTANDDGVLITEEEEEEITWPKVAQTLDRLFFAVFLMVVLLATIILLPLMVILVNG